MLAFGKSVYEVLQEKAVDFGKHKFFEYIFDIAFEYLHIAAVGACLYVGLFYGLNPTNEVLVEK